MDTAHAKYVHLVQTAMALSQARIRDGYLSNAIPGAQHTYDLWRQRLWLINQASFIGVYGTKIMGGVASSTVEPYILPPSNAQPVK